MGESGTILNIYHRPSHPSGPAGPRIWPENSKKQRFLVKIAAQGPQNTNEINLTVMNCDMDISSQTLTDFLA